MAMKRGNHEGSIVRRKDGRWMASITIGRTWDPATSRASPCRLQKYALTTRALSADRVQR
jgi:hypothetical protein